MGQRQRLRIAMTFLPDPEVVLLDEPLTSLGHGGFGAAPEGPRRGPGPGRCRAVVLAQRRTRRHELRHALADRRRKAGAGVSDALVSWQAFWAVMRRDLHVYLTYRTRLVSQVLTAIFSLTLFYYVSRLVYVKGFPSHNAYFGFVVVGIALISVMYSCFSIAELVRQELIAGTFDRLLLSPFGAVRSVIAMTLFPIAYSFVLAGITLGLGCAIFGLQLHWSTVPLSIPLMLLVLLSFLPFGILFAALTVVIKQGTVATTWVIALLSIVGGLYFPVSLLPRMGADRLQNAAVHRRDRDAAQPARAAPRSPGSAASALLKLAASPPCCCPCRSWPSPAPSASASGAARSSSTESERMTPLTDPNAASLLTCKVTVPQHVVYRSFPTETVVLNLNTGKYHGLNATAGRMLDELEERRQRSRRRRRARRGLRAAPERDRARPMRAVRVAAGERADRDGWQSIALSAAAPAGAQNGQPRAAARTQSAPGSRSRSSARMGRRGGRCGARR